MKILILEDEKTIRNALRFALKKAGHDVQEYENPLKAAEMFDKTRFDLLIVDLMLPHLPGYEFISMLQSRQQLVPTIVLTSHPETARELIDFEALNDIRLEIISKDLPFRTIIERIQHFLMPIYTK